MSPMRRQPGFLTSGIELSGGTAMAGTECVPHIILRGEYAIKVYAEAIGGSVEGSTARAALHVQQQGSRDHI